MPRSPSSLPDPQGSLLRRGRAAVEAVQELRSRAVKKLVASMLRPLASGGTKAKGPLPSGRRILLLHLDGVGRSQLAWAMRKGAVPNLSRLLSRGSHKLSRCRAGAPTSTPAFQAGLLYGAPADIPGYTWFDKRSRRPVRMDSCDDARKLEGDLAARGTPLLLGGSVYCSIFHGGARPERWALSGLDQPMSAADFGTDGLSAGTLSAGLRDLGASALVHAATAGRIGVALGADVASGLFETARWVRSVGSMQHEPQFLFHRVLTECLFAEFAANATLIDVVRGTPIVYSCFIGYDEYAHRRGPRSALALLKLRELDLSLGRIFAACDAVPELGYEVYLFSDHGQAETRPAEQVLGETLAEHLLGESAPAALSGGGDAAQLAALVGRWRRLSAVLPGLLGRGALAWARHESAGLDAGSPGCALGPLVVVPAGDLGHIYSLTDPEPLDEAALRQRHPQLIERCVACPAIGVTLLRGGAGAVAYHRGRRFELSQPADAAQLSKLLGHPLLAGYARDLLHRRSAGDLVILGVGAEGGTVSFPWEFGSHGGLSADELETFVVHPAALGDQPFAQVSGPIDLHQFFLERSGRAAQPMAAGGGSSG